MKVGMGLGITNNCEMKLLNVSSMYSSGSKSIALGTSARTFRASGTAVGCIDGCSGCFSLEGWEALDWTGILASLVDCGFPLGSGPRFRVCSRLLRWHPTDVDFLDALGTRPSGVARGL